MHQTHPLTFILCLNNSLLLPFIFAKNNSAFGFTLPPLQLSISRFQLFLAFRFEMDHPIELSSDSDSGIELHPSPVARRLRVFRRQASPSSRPVPGPVPQHPPSRIPRPANSLLGPNRGRPIQLLRRPAPAPLPRRLPAPAAASASSSRRPCNRPPTPAAAAGRPQPRLTPAARRQLLEANQAQTASRHAVVPAAIRVPTRPRLITSRREPTPPPPPSQASQSWFVSLSEEERLLSPSPSEASTIEARPSRDASTQTSPPRSSHASTQTSSRQSASIGIQAEIIVPAPPTPAPPPLAVPQPWPSASNWMQRNLAHQVLRSQRRAQQHREATQRRLQFFRRSPPPLPRRRPHHRAPGA